MKSKTMMRFLRLDPLKEIKKMQSNVSQQTPLSQNIIHYIVKLPKLIILRSDKKKSKQLKKKKDSQNLSNESTRKIIRNRKKKN